MVDSPLLLKNSIANNELPDLISRREMLTTHFKNPENFSPSCINIEKVRRLTN